MPIDKWTREQTIVVFNLYCKIPFNRVSSTHPDIVRIARIIGRSTNSVKMKIGNFGSFDPELKKRGIVGLGNTSKLDENIWNEFNNNWGKLAYESELLIAKFSKKTIEETAYIEAAKYFDDFKKDGVVKDLFFKYNNQSIILPDKFLPSKEFLDYHYKDIFIK